MVSYDNHWDVGSVLSFALWAITFLFWRFAS